MLRRPRIGLPRIPKPWSPSRRCLHDNGIFGLHQPRVSLEESFTSEELANRARNASLLRLVESYRRHGHRAARLDPLDLIERPPVPALSPQRYGFQLQQDVRDDFKSPTLPSESIASASERIDTRGILDFPAQEADKGEGRTIEQIAKRLEDVYCQGVGYEFMHLPDKTERRFLERLLETSHLAPIKPERQLEQWRLLAASEIFDAWAAKRFPQVKRYGLEGAEGMMVAVEQVLKRAQESGAEDLVIAMPHRGRLNLLTQLLGMDMRLLVRKMRGLATLPPSLPASQFTDDVLSHLFLTTDYSSGPNKGSESKSLKVHLLPNPSHLETVGPVAVGYARALQVPLGTVSQGGLKGDYELGHKVRSLQIHGDAAFGGQGVVAETLNLANLPHFTVGGSIRIVVNNQLGYTTPASSGRSSFYATSLAHSIHAPVVHVNGDRIDDVARAVDLAVAFQRKFRREVVLDIISYRRRGHNELDEPAYTSPTMYKAIEKLPSVAQIYERQLLESGILSSEEATSFRSSLFAKLDEALTAAEPENFTVPEVKRERGWDKMTWPQENQWKEAIQTGVREDVLLAVGRRSVDIDKNVTPHPRLLRMHVSKRLQSLEKGEGLDFATAEALAFGSLMLEGTHVRLCGQDSGRGTFSNRHAIISDQEHATLSTVPLQSLTDSPPHGLAKDGVSPGTIEIVNSPLSEYAVVGYEQGVAYASPDILPLWEAQFGDFHNTAQVTIDTYLGSGETKWGLQSALTLLLPHGSDGAGPEHSSSRIERFLQLTNEPLRRKPFVPNMHLVNPTTAAQYFHVLRRQMVRTYRKPLVVFSPKGILRLPQASSKLAELAEGTSFQPVLVDDMPDTSAVERVVLLSGKMYYSLIKKRAELGLESKVAFVRIEEISPFPYEQVEAALSRFENATSFIYAQEEPENAGAFLFCLPRLQSLLSAGVELQYAGREAMATPAPGVPSRYAESAKHVLDQVFQGVEK